MHSAQRGVGREWNWRDSSGNRDLFLARVHSTKAVKSTRGPSSDDSTLQRVIRVAGEFREGQKQSGMVLERMVPLLQQEEEEFRAKKGVHGEHNGNKTLNKNGG